MAAAKGRQGSAERLHTVPHTRIEGEKQFEEIYSIGGPLGEGSFGVVREVVHRKTQKRWACKAINREKAGSSKIKLLEREVNILKRVRHEHIICLKEVFETPQKMYLVMELCEGGELSKELRRKGKMDEETVKTIMARLASAIAYLHKNDMVHRDLKLENILLSRNPNASSDHLYIKVTDFGLSVVKGGVGHDNMMMDFCGTPMYMAPEIIDNKTYGQLCDVWAMGVIMYFLISGTSPFSDTSNDEELYAMIKTLNIRQVVDRNVHWKNVSSEAKRLLEQMLTVDPAYRRSASEVLDDPWITGESPSDGPRNVLDMMKEFSQQGKESEKITAVNGSGVSPSKSDDLSDRNGTGMDSEASSRDGSASSRKGKESAGSHRNSLTGTPITGPTKTKKLTRNSTDPNLQQTAANANRNSIGGKPSISSRAQMSKSKSPIEKDSSRLGSSAVKGKGQGVKPLATRTSPSSTPSSSSTSNNNNPSQRTAENHKPKKKISR